MKGFLYYYAPEYLLRIGGVTALGAAAAAGIWLLQKNVNALKTRLFCTVMAILVQVVLTLNRMQSGRLFRGTSYFQQMFRSEFIAYLLPLLIVLAVQILRLILRNKEKAAESEKLPQAGNAAVFSLGAMLLGCIRLLPNARTTLHPTLFTALEQNPTRFFLCGVIPAALGLIALILSRLAAHKLAKNLLLRTEHAETQLSETDSTMFAAQRLTAIAACLALAACIFYVAASLYIWHFGIYSFAEKASSIARGIFT